MGAPPILIYRLGSLGDTMVALPAFHAIERAFPGRERLVLTNVPVSTKAAPLAAILQPGGLIDGVIAYPVGTRSPWKLWRVARAIRRTRADTLIYLAAARGLANVRRDLAFFRLAGIRHVIGAPTTADLHDNRVVDGVVEPEAERLARTLTTLEPIDLDHPAGWDLRVTPEERAAADRALAPLDGRPFLAINMGGKDASKDWGEANWAALLARIAPSLPSHALVSVGAAEDSNRASAITPHWPGPALDLCGALSPRESGAALARARAFIGHDSGPLHLAAAAGTPSLGLFGNFNEPRKWHPYGARHRVVHEMQGTAAITVERVVAAFADLIA